MNFSDAPVLPIGYNIVRRIGSWSSNSSIQLLPGISSGYGNYRVKQHDVPQVALTAGVATTYATVNLKAFVPSINNLPVLISTAYVPGTAANTLSIRTSNTTGPQVIVTGQVTAMRVNNGPVQILSSLVSGNPSIDYQVSNGSDSAGISVVGYVDLV